MGAVSKSGSPWVVRLDLPEKLNVSVNLMEVKELLKDVDEDGCIQIYLVFYLLIVSFLAFSAFFQ